MSRSHERDVGAAVPHLGGRLAIVPEAKDVTAGREVRGDLDHIAYSDVVPVALAVRAVGLECRLARLAVVVAP